MLSLRQVHRVPAKHVRYDYRLILVHIPLTRSRLNVSLGRNRSGFSHRFAIAFRSFVLFICLSDSDLSARPRAGRRRSNDDTSNRTAPAACTRTITVAAVGQSTRISLVYNVIVPVLCTR